MLISPPSRTSLMSLLSEDFFTARCTSALARRRNFWRFSRLLPPGFRRRSTICIGPHTYASARLLGAHVPFDEAAYLTLRVAASDHSLDEVGVLLFGLAIFLGAERDHRQQ